MTTFEDVSSQYAKSAGYMAHNEQLVFDTPSPVHATWLNETTLARWFYGASREWIREFDMAVKGLRVISPEKEEYLGEWRLDLIKRLERFRERSSTRFSEDKLLMEATA